MAIEHRSWKEIFQDLRAAAAANEKKAELKNVRNSIGFFMPVDDSMTMPEVIDKFEKHVTENFEFFEDLRKLLL
jgi:hypothetical protein